MKRAFCLLAIISLVWVCLLGQSKKKEDQLEYYGRLSVNKFSPDSTSNEFGVFGSRFSPLSVNNPYSKPGSAAQSKFSLGGPAIVGEDGTYLGKLNKNEYDPESVASPYGVYGSKYSPSSINNPYSVYGSPYSSHSPRNPLTTQAPKLYMPKSGNSSVFGGSTFGTQSPKLYTPKYGSGSPFGGSTFGTQQNPWNPLKKRE